MNKYMFLYYGFWTPTQEMKDAWGEWFGTFGHKIIDGGNPFGAAKEITREGTRDLPMGLDSIVGYTVINADNMAEAEAIAQACPIVTGIRVYEAASM